MSTATKAQLACRAQRFQPSEEGWTPKALLGKGDDLELPLRVDALFLALDVALKRCVELEAEIDRLLLALANKGGAA